MPRPRWSAARGGAGCARAGQGLCRATAACGKFGRRQQLSAGQAGAPGQVRVFGPRVGFWSQSRFLGPEAIFGPRCAPRGVRHTSLTRRIRRKVGRQRRQKLLGLGQGPRFGRLALQATFGESLARFGRAISTCEHDLRNFAAYRPARPLANSAITCAYRLVTLPLGSARRRVLGGYYRALSGCLKIHHDSNTGHVTGGEGRAKGRRYRADTKNMEDMSRTGVTSHARAIHMALLSRLSL